MSSDWILYIIANTVDPYAYELPIILAYPNGCSYRARFKREWLDSSLISELARLPGLACLIVYRDHATGDLYPIRYGEVSEVNTYGDVVYIEYVLADIVPYGNNSDKRNDQLKQFRTEFRSEHPVASTTNRPNEDMRPLVFKSRFRPEIENPYLGGEPGDSKEFKSWSNVCEIVADVPVYGGCEFLRIIGLSEEGRLEGLIPKRNTYSLRPDRSYVLRVAQRVFRPPVRVRPHEVAFRCDGRGVRVITERRRAVGKYDTLVFRFRTERTGGRTSTGVLSLTGRMAENEPFELEAIVQVRPELGVVSLALTVVGAIALMWPEAAVHLGAAAEYKDFYQRVGTLFFVMGVIDSRSVLELLRSR